MDPTEEDEDIGEAEATLEEGNEFRGNAQGDVHLEEAAVAGGAAHGSDGEGEEGDDEADQQAAFEEQVAADMHYYDVMFDEDAEDEWEWDSDVDDPPF